MSCAKWRTSSTDAIRVLLRFIGMPQRSLASLVLGPVLIGVLCLALACVAGARTDRLGDTLSVADTLHATDSARADTLRRIDSTRSADADSAAASHLAVVVDDQHIRVIATDAGRYTMQRQRRMSAHVEEMPGDRRFRHTAGLPRHRCPETKLSRARAD